jgi:tryptophan synthase beta subunit
MKIKKKILLIDQHDKDFMYGGKFGGNFIPETLKKPIDDLTKFFSQLYWCPYSIHKTG